MNKTLLFKNIYAGIGFGILLFSIGFIVTDWRYWVMLFISLLIINLFFMKTATPDRKTIATDYVKAKSEDDASTHTIKLNKNQYEILMNMPHLDKVYKYYDLFIHTNMDLITLKKEMKTLRDMGLVTFVSTFNAKTGHMTGSGHVITSDRIQETVALVHQYERNHRIFIS